MNPITLYLLKFLSEKGSFCLTEGKNPGKLDSMLSKVDILLTSNFLSHTLYRLGLNGKTKCIDIQVDYRKWNQKKINATGKLVVICKLIICHFTLDKWQSSRYKWLFLPLTPSLKCKRNNVFSSPAGPLEKEDFSIGTW